MAEKLSLDVLVRLAASNKIPTKYNLAQFKEDKARMVLHKQICEDVVRIADENKVPITYLVYFMVGKDCHKVSTFNKGYVSCNPIKAMAIIRMAKEFAAHHGYKKPTDRVYHAMTAFYERVSTDYDVFAARLAAMQPNHNFTLVKDIYKAMGGE